MAKRASIATPSAFKVIKRTGSTAQVREQLLGAIHRGDYPPGSALPSERVLCETFAVSRVSVREAIAGLEAIGLIRVEHGRGVFVREWVGDQYQGSFGAYLEIHRDELVELLKVRGALDELAADEAAANGTKTKLAALSAAHAAFKQAVTDGATPEQLVALDVAFHMSIALSSGGTLLPSLLGELNGILEESRLMVLGRAGQAARSAAQHEAILDAILCGDGRAARRAVASHLASTRKFFETLPKLGASTG